MKQLVRIEPKIVPITDGYQGTYPDHNEYNLIRTYQFGDDRFTSPLSGFNTEVWLLEGLSTDIDNFVSDNSTMVTKLTPADAKTLADTIRPEKTVKRKCFGVLVDDHILAWTSPI